MPELADGIGGSVNFTFEFSFGIGIVTDEVPLSFKK